MGSHHCLMLKQDAPFAAHATLYKWHVWNPFSCQVALHSTPPGHHCRLQQCCLLREQCCLRPDLLVVLAIAPLKGRAAQKLEDCLPLGALATLYMDALGALKLIRAAVNHCEVPVGCVKIVQPQV